MTGLPYLIRVVVPTLGLRKPKVPVRGMDVAGTVEAVGAQAVAYQRPDPQQFRIGGSREVLGAEGQRPGFGNKGSCSCHGD